MSSISEEIANLYPTKIEDLGIDIKHDLLFTMVDGKICNYLTQTSSTQSCYICKAKPTEMNNIQKVSLKIPTANNYGFGISPLHSWIRCLECCLHIAYKIDFKTHQARGAKKIVVEKKKQEIREKLRKELGILVDQPKPGYGSTNDGNTARKFFRDPSLTSRLTGLDENFLRRFQTILITLNCGYEVNADRFDSYAKETAELYVQLYGWYFMPPSVHKILIHGGEIVRHALLPIGQLSEEAQEAKNKDFKFIREHRSRKHSRKHTNEDLMNYLILSSDPCISLIARKKFSKR